MDTFFRFLYEFLSQFFNGLKLIVMGLFNGIVKIFDFKAYLDIVNYYKNDFNMPEWLLVGLAILVMIIVLGLIFLGIYFLIRKYVRIRKTLVDQESLLEEVSTLNSKVATLMKEKEDILAMKVSKLGLKPDEADTEEVSENEGTDKNTEIRFPKLYEVDEKYKDYKIVNYNNTLIYLS